MRKRIFRKSKNFDFELKIICRFTIVFDSIENENEQQFIDLTIAFIDDENEQLFVVCFKNKKNEQRFLTLFNNFDFANRLLTTIFD